MKKSVSLILALSVWMAGYSQIQKAAVISVFGNKNLSDNPLDTKLYEAILKDSSFNISNTVVEFESIIQSKLIPAFGFPFLDKQTITGSPDYQALDSIVMYKMGYYGKGLEQQSGQNLIDLLNPLIPAPGYVNIAAFGPVATDKEAIQRAFEIFPDIDAVLIAYVDFTIYDAAGTMGMTSKKVYANVNIKMFNKDAKRIFRLRERATSDKGVMAVGGLVLDTEKITPLIDDAAKRLFAEMQGKIPKSLAKMAAKIDKSAGEDE